MSRGVEKGIGECVGVWVEVREDVGRGVENVRKCME